jgi:hypothetical protein
MVFLKVFGCVASKGTLIENETKYGLKETMSYVKVNYRPSVCFFGRGMVVIHTIWRLLSLSTNKIAKA